MPLLILMIRVKLMLSLLNINKVMDKLGWFVNIIDNAGQIFYIILGIAAIYIGVLLRVKGISKRDRGIIMPLIQSREDIKAGRYKTVLARYIDVLVIYSGIQLVAVSLIKLFKSSIPDIAEGITAVVIGLAVSLIFALWNTYSAYIGYFYERENIQGVVEGHESIKIDGKEYLKPIIAYKFNGETKRHTEICIYPPKKVPPIGTLIDLIYCEENEKVMTHRELHKVRMYAFYGWSAVIIIVLIISGKFILKIG